MESPYPPSIQKLIDEFAKLPGIGRRSAERVTYHVLSSPRTEAMALAVAIRDAKARIRACTRCFHIAEGELCEICASPRREQGQICVVELPRDLIAIEKSGAYHGSYHVLQGHLSPQEGIGPEQLRIRELLQRVQNPALNGGVRATEIILALNPTMEGDVTASYLAQELSALPVRTTRLARGLSTGSEIESAAPSSILYALKGRQNFQPDALPPVEPAAETKNNGKSSRTATPSSRKAAKATPTKPAAQTPAVTADEVDEPDSSEEHDS